MREHRYSVEMPHSPEAPNRTKFSEYRPDLVDGGDAAAAPATP